MQMLELKIDLFLQSAGGINWPNVLKVAHQGVPLMDPWVKTVCNVRVRKLKVTQFFWLGQMGHPHLSKCCKTDFKNADMLTTRQRYALPTITKKPPYSPKVVSCPKNISKMPQMCPKNDPKVS